MFTLVIVTLLLADPIHSAVPQFSSEEYTKTPRLVEVWQNGRVSLKCPPRGVPGTRYRWYKMINGTTDKQAVALNDRFEQVLDNLLITRANFGDAGRYVCVSNISAGTESSETILTIMTPLKASITRQGQATGISTLASCTSPNEGNTDAPVSREGEELSGHFNYLSLLSGLLQIPLRVPVPVPEVPSVSNPNHHNVAGDDDGFIVIEPWESPEIWRGVGERLLQPGEAISLMCMASGNPKPEISWDVDGKGITEGDSVQVGKYVNNDGHVVSHLYMTDVHTNDGGVYKCTATNKLGSKEHSARINVYGLPYVKPMENISIVVGDMLIVTCPVAGHPIETISWEHNNRSLPINRNQKVFSNGTLIINNFERSSTPHTYVCIAKDPQGYSARASLEVHVLAPPLFEIKVHNQTGHLGDPAALQCEAKGNKPIDILWYINGQRLEPNAEDRFTIRKQLTPDGVKSDLSIKRTERVDSASFTCAAINAFGSDNTTIHMIVQEVPGIPHVVQILNKSLHGVQLSWAAPYDGSSSIQQYQIEYQISEGSWERVSVSGQHNETSITGLRPGTIYQLRIVAVNKVGSSEPSDTIQFITLEDVPSGPPTDVRVEAANSHALDVWWKPPERALQNGKILGYNVGHKPTDSDDAYIFQAVGSERKFGKDNHLEISELKPYTSYVVTVKAFNKAGTGPGSKAVYTAEDVPEEIPRNVTCTAITSQRIHVSWAAPRLAARNIQGYKVIYGPSDLSDPMDSVVTSSNKTFLDGLEKYTNYSVQVLTVTAVGNEAYSDPIHCQTEEDVPNEPTNIKAIIKSSDSVLVGWQPPTKPNGIVVHYTVYVKEVSDKSSKVIKLSYKVQPTEMIYEVTELDKSKSYEFYVTASTYMGEGKPSSTVLRSLANRRVPDSPQVTVLGTTTTTITLKMQPNIADTELLHAYTISYFRHDNESLGRMAQIVGNSITFSCNQTLKLASPVEHYTLENLWCGEIYNIFVNGYNSMGKGYSKKLVVQTNRSALIAPTHSQFITPLSDGVKLHLDSWSNEEYPISMFQLRYHRYNDRSGDNKKWSRPVDDLYIDKLQPSTQYSLHVEAIHKCGRTTAQYKFQTLSCSCG